MYLPGVPAHVVQSGNNREACFFQDEDYQFYLAVLGDALKRYRVQLHAYVLMTNHVHLLMTPADESGISRVMQHLGRMYVLYVKEKKGTDLFSRLAVLNKSPFAHRRTVRLTISLPSGGLLSKLSGNLLRSVFELLINIV
jgi:REP element-mobilizing transposase RayT